MKAKTIATLGVTAILLADFIVVLLAIMLSSVRFNGDVGARWGVLAVILVGLALIIWLYIDGFLVGDERGVGKESAIRSFVIFLALSHAASLLLVVFAFAMLNSGGSIPYSIVAVSFLLFGSVRYGLIWGFIALVALYSFVAKGIVRLSNRKRDL